MIIRSSVIRLLFFLIVTTPCLGQAVYNSNPDWESSDTGYSTGAAFADIDNNGYLDLVVSNGNDMAKEPLSVYYNKGDGTFPSYPNWNSQDKTYNGHLDVADVNGDGWPDVAVSHLMQSTSGDSAAKLYLNNNGTLSSLPDWSSSEKAQAFGVAFGDMNNDGRPDLAVATGWAYSPPKYFKNYVYLNVNGMLSNSASWSSDDSTTDQGVIWVDADNDGWLDLACTGAKNNSRIYRNLGGVLDEKHIWNSTDNNNQDSIMMTAGDVTGDGYKEIFITDNKQLAGGLGPFRQYNGLSTGYFTTKPVWTYPGGYSSAISLADIDTDGDLDLATGAWWDHTLLFYNNGQGFLSQPNWSSGKTSVIEKIVFGDVNPTADSVKLFTNRFYPTGNSRLFHLSRCQIQGIESVRLDGVKLTPSRYFANREFGWITVDAAPQSLLEVNFYYSASLDMAISNWDSSKGNYLYYNKRDPRWLAASTDIVSASAGGTVDLEIDAAEENSNRNYIILGSLSGSSPGTGLPGGMTVLPINWDLFTSLTLNFKNTPSFQNFMGVLDALGRKSARLDTKGPIPAGYVGLTMSFAYGLNNKWNFTSNAVTVRIIP